MEQLLHDAEELTIAASAPGRDIDESHLICFTHGGGVRVLTDAGPCSLAAVAAEFGADKAFLVERRNGDVRVEGWSGRSSVVVRKGAAAAAALLPPSYPTIDVLGIWQA